MFGFCHGFLLFCMVWIEARKFLGTIFTPPVMHILHRYREEINVSHTSVPERFEDIKDDFLKSMIMPYKLYRELNQTMRKEK